MALLAPARVLPSPLGRWLHPSHQVSRWDFSPEKDQLLNREGQTTVLFARKDGTKTRNSGQTFSYSSRILEYPNIVTPTTVSWDGSNPNEITMEGYTTSLPSYFSPSSLEYPVGNDDYVRVSTRGYKKELIRAARKGRLVAVSDASFYMSKNEDVVAAAWQLETDDQLVQWEGSGLMFVRKNSSYGGEIYCIYLVCRFLSDMWPEQLIYLGRVELRCDNKSGVWDCMDDCLKTRKMK